MNLCLLFSLQVSGEDHRRPDDVLPRWNHPDIHSQPKRSRAQFQTGQHLKGRSLPAKSKAAVQVSCRRHVYSQLCLKL